MPLRNQLADELDRTGNISLITLAGEQYRTIFRDLPWPYEIPMRALRKPPSTSLPAGA